MTHPTLSPDVREALERLALVEQRSGWLLSVNFDFIAIRAELVRLAEECAKFDEETMACSMIAAEAIDETMAGTPKDFVRRLATKLQQAESERDELRAKLASQIQTAQNTHSPPQRS